MYHRLGGLNYREDPNNVRGSRQEHTLLNTPSAAGLSRLSKCLSSLANVSREERDVRCRVQRKTRASDPSTFAHFHLPKTLRGRAFFASERVAATTECIEGVQRRVADLGRGGAGREGEMRGMRELDATLFIGGPPSIQSSSRWDSRRCGKEREGPRGGLGVGGGGAEGNTLLFRSVS